MRLIKLHLSDSVYLSLFVLHLANSNHNLHTSWELYQIVPEIESQYSVMLIIFHTISFLISQYEIIHVAK